MIALKVLLTVAGVLLMAAALSDSAVWALAAHSVCTEEDERRSTKPVAEPEVDCVARSGGAGAGGMPAAAGGDEHGGGAERHGRRAVSQIGGTIAGHAVSGIALCDAAGGDACRCSICATPVYGGHCGAGEQGCRRKGRTERAVARRSEYRAGGDGALPARSQRSWRACRRICRSRWTRNWCRRWWRVRGASLRRSTRCARSSARSAKRCGRRRRQRLRASWRPTGSWWKR